MTENETINSSDEVTEVQMKPLVANAFEPSEIERQQWRREASLRYVFGLVEKQPDLLRSMSAPSESGGLRAMRYPETHIETASRIVEMAHVVELYLAGGLDGD